MAGEVFMLLENYRPQAKLVKKITQVDRPRYPVIDAHNHVGDGFSAWERKSVSELVDQLDQAGVVGYVDLDGGWGEDILNNHLDQFKAFAPERFRIFGGVDWSQWPEMGNRFPDWAAGRIKTQKDRGADGVKIWKPFGLSVRDPQGDLVKVDDSRLDPIWQVCGELGLPVLIHVADPVAFFDPVDESNERWEELSNHPDWVFTSPPFPSFISILQGFYNLVMRNPGTTFIGAHVGCYAENLAWVGKMLDDCPNYYVDISARFGELGRQPYSARKFFIKYQDRILYGSDMGPDVEAYRLSYRFLETDDEYFNDNAGEVPQQGRWHVHGLFLPDDILEKVYHRNAQRILNY
jgi:predicted TIM-barrel fold metal-dependent hydrolase